jgi:hypothetical protein
MANLTQARLRGYFNYDPSIGRLIVKERPSSEFDSLAYARHLKQVGKPAGSINKGGYRKVHIDGRYYSEHRVIWLFVFGQWPAYPEFEIDHLNGVKSDNRIQNLRKCSKSMNQRNGSMRRNNTSGVIGVNWVRSKGAWIARIWDGPRHRYLGQFKDIAEAAAARAKAEQEIGYHPGHGKPAREAR